MWALMDYGDFLVLSKRYFVAAQSTIQFASRLLLGCEL
jgi:hypothetical protein